jgi:hypothetical protein
MATFPTMTPFSLVEIVVASYTAFGDYGTPVSLDIDQILTLEPQADTDDLRDSGAIVDGLTVVTHATGTIGFGGITLAALNIMTGNSSASTGAAGNRIITRNWDAGADGLPYFATIGVARASNAQRKVIAIPKMLLDTYPTFSLDGTENKFIINEVGFRAFADGANARVFIEKDYEDATDYTTPATAVEFEAFFA